MDAKTYVLKWRDGTVCRVYWSTAETYLPKQILDHTVDYIAEVILKLGIKFKEQQRLSFICLGNFLPLLTTFTTSAEAAEVVPANGSGVHDRDRCVAIS